MIAIVCLSNADATGLSAAVDARIGFPQEGIDIGEGIHASKTESRTTGYGPIIKHPTLNLWAYPQDTTVQTQLTKGVALPVGATVQTLDATWNLTAVAAGTAISDTP